MMKTAYLALLALLTAPAGAAEQPLSQDQQDACGSLLCLAGGAATPECNPYLKKFFATNPKDRKGYLNKCPSSGVSEGAINELVSYGQSCASDKLAAMLNRQLCTAEQKDQRIPCRGDNPAAWRMCDNYYAELTDEKPPRLVQRCRNERDLTGGMEQVCSQRWVTGDYETGSWCTDKDESCEESDVGDKTLSALDEQQELTKSLPSSCRPLVQRNRAGADGSRWSSAAPARLLGELCPAFGVATGDSAGRPPANPSNCAHASFSSGFGGHFFG